jgi:hypothetical protein
MISTTDLTAVQLLQLDALLADTTPGGGCYRPPVARDVEALRELAEAGLALYVEDIGPTYEITDAGREIVIEHAMYAAEGVEFVQHAGDDELRATIEYLKAELPQLGDLLRERAMADIEVCQDELDRRADGSSEGTGRHRLVPVDDRPTAALPRVEDDTAPLPFTGTLPGLPVVVERAQHDVPDHESAMRILAALKATPSPAELAELAAVSTAGWQALEADLGDESRWWHRRVAPHAAVLVAVAVTAIVTFGFTWLVIA